MFAAGLIALTPQSAQADPGLLTFGYSPAPQQWVVPANVGQVTVQVQGAAGGAGGKEGGSGGRGASGSFTMDVTPGRTLQFGVGERGENAAADAPGGEGDGGFQIAGRGGGDGGVGAPGGFTPGANGGAGGGGGAATAVQYNGSGAFTTVIVAAGGGGGGGQSGYKYKGGDGGDADEDGFWGGIAPGFPTDVLGGGSGDSEDAGGTDGDDAVVSLDADGGGGAGGGGGGFQGGTGGDTIATSGGAGGGGGSSYFDAQRVTETSPFVSNVEGNGSVRLTWSYNTGMTIDDPNTVVTGQDKSYTVRLQKSNAIQDLTGDIEFSIQNLGTGVTTPLQTKPVAANGTATFFETGLLVGNYRISATYLPAADNGSLTTSLDRNFAVVKGDSKTIIAGPSDPPSLGESVDLGVSVSAISPAKGTPSGQVRFFAGGVPIVNGLVNLDADGKAVLTTTKLPVGTYDITANYLGDDEFEPSLDEVSLQDFTVNQGDVSVTLSSPFNPVIAGQQSVFDVTVAQTNGSIKPTGSVQLLINDVAFGPTQPVAPNGTVRFAYVLPVTNPDAPHRVRAVYLGDANYGSATSNDITQTVNAGTAKVKLTSDLNPSRVNQDVTFSIDVDGNLPTKPTEPTGEVQLYINGSPFNAPISIDVNGQATITTDTLPVGVNTVTATYLGDDNYGEATSGPLQQVVNKQLVAVTLTANDTQLQYGEKLTLTAKVATEKGDLATGQVQFYDNGVAVGGPALLDGVGQATISSEQVSKGVHQYSAKYLGDAKNPEGVSNTVEVSVLKNTLSFHLITNRVPAYQGDDILLHARLTADAGSVGKIAGVVQYYSDGNAYGRPVPVNGNNWASLVVRKQKVGMHRFTAKFIPAADSPFETNTASGVIQRVLKGKPNASVRMSVKRTSPTTATLKVRVRKNKGGYAGGYVQLYIDGSPTQLVKLAKGGAVKTVTLTGLSTRPVFVTANYRPRGSTKQAGKSLTLREFK